MMSDFRCKVGERIRIGHDVVIKIVAVEGENVRLTIKVPETTDVWREEPQLHQPDDTLGYFHSE